MSSANVSVWFEIPARDLARAKRFYDSVFAVSLKLEDFGPHKLAIFPGEPGQNSGCLIHGEGYEASGRATTFRSALAFIAAWEVASPKCSCESSGKKSSSGFPGSMSWPNPSA